MIDGVSTSKAAKRCDVDYKTAFRWRHRFLDSLSGDKPRALSGIVEGDETFILESFKGKRSGISRAARKRGGQAGQMRHLCRTDSCDRRARSSWRNHRCGAAEVEPSVHYRSAWWCRHPRQRILLRWWLRYCCLRRKAGIPTHILPAPGNQTTSSRFSHQHVNAYHSRLKEWMRRFHGVATKNLPNYLGWRRTFLQPRSYRYHCLRGNCTGPVLAALAHGDGELDWSAIAKRAAEDAG